MAGVEEARYTLEQAKAELARRECEMYGHDWDIISSGRRPVRILCSRCFCHAGVTALLQPGEGV